MTMYEHVVSMYWSMKGLIGQILLEREDKILGDGILVHFGKMHLMDSQLIHKKIDVISHHLGIPFLPYLKEGGASITSYPSAALFGFSSSFQGVFCVVPST